MKHLFADGSYNRLKLMEKATSLNFVVEIIGRSDTQKSFEVLPRRWVVERSFGWMTRWRRLVRDYAARVDVSEAMVPVAMEGNMLRTTTHPRISKQTLKVRLDSSRQRANRCSRSTAEAAQKNVSANAMVASTSLARRRSRLIQAKNSATTHRRVWTVKPTWPSGLRTISTRIGLAAAKRGP